MAVNGKTDPYETLGAWKTCRENTSGRIWEKTSAWSIRCGFLKRIVIDKIYAYGSIPINTIFRGWTSIYQLFWCSPGVQGFDTLPYIYKIRMLEIFGIWITAYLATWDSNWRRWRNDIAGRFFAPKVSFRQIWAICLLRLSLGYIFMYMYSYKVVPPVGIPNLLYHIAYLVFVYIELVGNSVFQTPSSSIITWLYQ